jgi:hypothetical protein
MKQRILHRLLLSIGMLMVVLSVAAAVYGYEVDDNIYRLGISSVSIPSEDQLDFRLSNTRRSDFDLSDLHSYKVTQGSTRISGWFTHTVGDYNSMVGILDSGSNMPYSLSLNKPIMCGIPLTIEMQTFKGKLVARWVEIPYCKIKAPRPLGLQRLTPCKAEYYDGNLKLTWEIVEVDPETRHVLLEKSVGRLRPTRSWQPSTCADLESGVCMTDIKVEWVGDDVFVTLTDKRLDTEVTISNIDDSGIHCVKPKQPEPVFMPEDTAAPTPAVAQPAVAAPATDNQEYFMIQADNNPEVRVCLEGCKVGVQCYDEGTRADYLGRDAYCKGQTWMVQKRVGKSCSEDWECASENCARKACIDADTQLPKEGWLTRMLNWIDNLI